MGGGEGLAIDADREQELQGWRDELEHAERRIRQLSRGCSKQQQGRGRHQSGCKEEPAVVRRGAEARFARS